MEHRAQKSAEPKKAIYYDGSCPMCSNLMLRINASDQKGKFAPKDIKRESLPVAFSREQAEKEIHVVDSDGKVHKNAEAMLLIIEEYPRWRFLAKIGRLPIIRQLLPIGYAVISTNRHFLFGPAARVFYLKATATIGLMTGLFFSMNLWAGERVFPLAPVWSGMPAIPLAVGTTLFALMIGSLLAALVSPKPQKFIFSALGIGAVLALSDQMRLQPWFCHFFFMLATLGLFSWNHADTEKREAVLHTSRLIVASLYFFSGLQKVNVAFMVGIFPWMIEPISRFLPDILRGLPVALGVAVPFIEMAIGIGLLTKRWRKYAIAGAFAMLGIVLTALGPLGHDWNSVVWSWNVAMALFVVILFWRIGDVSFRDILWTRNFPFQKAVFVLFVIMPALSFFNLWDSYPSSALYSGNTNSAQIYISESLKGKLPAEAERYVIKTETGRNELDFFNWSFRELNVPPYPEARVYEAIARDICRYADAESDLSLVVHGKPTVVNPDKESVSDCSRYRI